MTPSPRAEPGTRRLALAGIGAILSVIVPISKSDVSASYVLITVGISGLVYQLFRLSADSARIPIPPLDWWGMNPLLIYVLHEVLLGTVVPPGVSWWYAEAAPWLVVAQAAALLAALTGVSLWLYRRPIIVSL